MIKNTLIFSTVIVLAISAVWFFAQKNRGINELNNNSNLAEPSPTPRPSSNESIKNSEPIKYDNGLIVQDVVIGNGKTAENGSTLGANYIGTLEDGTKFDSSYDRGQPLEFVLGSGQLIKGWELGLFGMKKGGKRKLVIPPELGYGPKGAGGLIPPNATLIFEIELVSVK